MRARLLRFSGDTEKVFEARRLLRQAIERDQSYAMAYALLGFTENFFLTTRVNDEYAAPATVERMTAATSKAVTLAPNDAVVRAYHGYSLRAVGDFDAADAEAICEAMSRPTMRFVAMNCGEIHRVLMASRTFGK